MILCYYGNNDHIIAVIIASLLPIVTRSIKGNKGFIKIVATEVVRDGGERMKIKLSFFEAPEPARAGWGHFIKGQVGPNRLGRSLRSRFVASFETQTF
jgi:hypothetical protein